jgi:hypothetical protein
MMYRLGNSFNYNYGYSSRYGGYRGSSQQAQSHSRYGGYQQPAYGWGNPGKGSSYSQPFQMASLIQLLRALLQHQYQQPAKPQAPQYPTTHPGQKPPAQPPCGCPTPPGNGGKPTNPPKHDPPTTPPGNGGTPTNPPKNDPPTTPPTTDPPSNPPVSGNFKPGSLSLDQVPVDSKGNIKQEFLKEMLTPKNAVDTKLTDPNSKSGLSKFALIGVRLMGHDVYDGKLDGDVFLRTLLAPEQSGNVPFTVDDQTIDMVKQWGKMDLEDDGKINGSVFGKLVEQVWPTTDKNAIPGFANSLKYQTASLNAAEMFRQTPNAETPEGLQEIMRQTGLTDTQFLDLSLWGHRIMDKATSTQDIAKDALNDPKSIDFGFAHLNDNTVKHVQNLTTDPNADATVGLSVLNLLRKLLK